MRKPFIKIADALFLFLTLLFVVVLSTDIVVIIANPEDYRLAHHFTDDNLSYKSDSIRMYIIRNVLYISIVSGIALLSFLKIYGKLSRNWIYFYYVTYIFLIGMMVLGYYKWSDTGFDH